MLICLSTSVKAKTIAFIVGIDDYDSVNVAQEDRVRRLHGCVNDAVSFGQVLISKYHLSADDIYYSLNEEATKNAITEALNSYKTILGEGDNLIFYFAGHGSQITNSLNGEPDHLDECLLTYDTPSKEVFIRDFELGYLLNQIGLTGCKVTCVIDACHSGSLLRSAEQNTRFHSSMTGYDIKKKDPKLFAEKNGVVLLSAAQDNQTAKEMTSSDGVKHGVFTNELIKVLLFQPTNTSMADLFGITEAHLRNKNIDQTPSVMGSQDRLNDNLAGQLSSSEELHFPIMKIDSSFIIIKGGKLIGLYPNSTLKTKDGNLYRVTQNIGYDKSKCVAVDPSTFGALSINNILYLNHFEYGTSRLKVFIPVAANIELLPYTEVATIYKHSKRAVTSNKIELVTELHEAEYFLFQVEDSLVFRRNNFAPSYMPNDFKIRSFEQVNELNRVMNTKRLLSLPSDVDYLFPYDLEVVNRTDVSVPFFLKNGSIYGIELKLNNELLASNYQKGLGVSQRFIYVLHVDSEGTVQQIYPSLGSNTDNKFPEERYGKQLEHFPLGKERLFVINEPFGHETFIMIASEMPIYELPWLEQMDKETGDFMQDLKPKYRAGEYKWNIKYYHYSSVGN